MRLILKAIYLTSTLLTLLIIVLPFFVLSSSPNVKYTQKTNHESLIKIKKTLYRNNPFNPQQIEKKQTVSFSEDTLNQAIQLGLQQKKIPIPASISLNKNLATLNGSMQLADTAFFLNFETEVYANNNQLIFKQIKLGQLLIPAFMIKPFYPYLFKFVNNNFPEIIAFMNVVEKIELGQDLLKVTYQWNNQLALELRSMGRDMMLNSEERQRIRIYYEKILEFDRQHFFRLATLDQLMQTVFLLASQRSRQSNEPVAENKAALLAMGMAVSGVRPSYIFQENIRKARLLQLTLKKRKDLAQHFLISAALSLITNQALSDAIGLSKEIDDSREGSGFSFPDLLADKAGIRLAELATKNKNSAIYVQEVLSNPKLSEQDFMPDFDKLPEAINELQFKKDYIDITHPNYLFVEKELNKRINNCSLHKRYSRMAS